VPQIPELTIEYTVTGLNIIKLIHLVILEICEMYYRYLTSTNLTNVKALCK